MWLKPNELITIFYPDLKVGAIKASQRKALATLFYSIRSDYFYSLLLLLNVIFYAG